MVLALVVVAVILFIASPPYSMLKDKGGFSATISWNPWTQGPDDKPVKQDQPLELRKSYEIHFDLATISYERWFPGYSRPSKVDPLLERTLRPLTAGKFTVFVKPILLGEGLEFIPGAEKGSRVSISWNRLRSPNVDLTGNEPDLPSFAEHANAARVTVSVHTTGPGCAAVALSIWNQEIKVPVDYVVRHYAVGASTKCPAVPEHQFDEGRLSLLNTPYERPADAALHVFEMEVGTTVRTAVVFLSGTSEASIMSWRLRRPLSEYLTGSGAADLPSNLKTARCDGANCKHDYSGLARQLAAFLFTDESGEQQLDADRAREALETLTSSATPPTVFLRLVDAGGNVNFLPLGLLGLKSGALLGERAHLITPMPIERPLNPGTCVRSWRFVLPERMDSVCEGCLDPPIPPTSEWIRSWELFEDYATKPGSDSGVQGLVLLAHHGGGKVSFQPDTSKDALLSDQLKHEFGRGSIAVLSACNVAGLAADNRGLPLLKKLNQLNLDTAIVSPFGIETSLGARFAFHFTEQIEKARKDNTAADLLELFRQTRDAVAQDRLVENLADELNEFLLVGNSQIKLCPAAPPS